MAIVRNAVALVALLLCGWTAAARGQDQGARRFDLICRGTGHAADDAKSWTVKTRSAVDLDKATFCDEASCAIFSKVDARTLAYQCQSHAGGSFCDAESISSTAGPFIWSDDLSIDRASGRYRRVMTGDQGDIVSHHFQITEAGRCSIAPFSKLAPTGNQP